MAAWWLNNPFCIQYGTVHPSSLIRHRFFFSQFRSCMFCKSRNITLIFQQKEKKISGTQFKKQRVLPEMKEAAFRHVFSPLQADHLWNVLGFRVVQGLRTIMLLKMKCYLQASHSALSALAHSLNSGILQISLHCDLFIYFGVMQK